MHKKNNKTIFYKTILLAFHFSINFEQTKNGNTGQLYDLKKACKAVNIQFLWVAAVKNSNKYTSCLIALELN